MVVVQGWWAYCGLLLGSAIGKVEGLVWCRSGCPFQSMPRHGMAPLKPLHALF